MSSIPEGLSAALADRYRLERELGQGGMATVYLAHDLKHDRKVAIKLLRPELAAVIGADRFLREIKTIANLQHPHILGLLDSGTVEVRSRESGVGSQESLPKSQESGVGSQESLGANSRLPTPDSRLLTVVYYVMPFVEGESLRDRLTREKQLPIVDALRIATEVASALDYAHRHGVIHRDIKPENVMLHDGSALVTDFGIALAVSSAGSTRMTETGMSLGTPHYMSPEQAMGEREITARSDVYALGVVTYEMLIGEPPFTGPTAQAIVAKVMTAEPDSLVAQRKSVPPEVESAVLTALEKLPADRFASAAEFAAALGGRTTVRSGTQRRTAGPPKRQITGLLGLALLIAGAAYLAGRWNRPASTVSGAPSRLSLLAPTVGLTTLLRQVAITPQGDAIVYAGTNATGDNVLYLQRLDAAEPTEIRGSNTMRSATISRDGRSMIALSSSAAYRLPLEGGSPRQLPAMVAAGVMGTWGPDGSYWFTEGNASGISRLTPDDSVLPFTLSRELGRGLRIQQFLDDGKTVMVTRAPPGTAVGPVLLLDLRTGQITRVLEGPVVEARIVGSELLAVLPDGSITATPFDTRLRRVTGSAVQVATGVSLSGTGVAHFAVADNGTLVYIPESPRSLVLMDRSGKVRPALEEHRLYHAPKFSPDGSRLSFDITASDRDVWTLDLAQHTLSRATFDHDAHDADWTADGRSLTYISFKSGELGIYRTRPGSTAPAESLIASSKLTYSGIWTRDGKSLITTGNDLNGVSSSDIALVENGGRGPIRPLVASPFQELYPALSPDDHWLAYVSDQSGRQEVYVKALTGDGDPVQVSQEGGNEPAWGPDGREMFYRSISPGQTELIAATVRAAPGFGVVGRRALFPLSDIVGAAPHSNYDISPDGRTFAMVQRSPTTRIVVIQNLAALLARLRSGAGAAP